MKNAFLLFVCFALFLCSTSCVQRDSAADILYRVCAEYELPSGETYIKSAEEGSAGYLDESMIQTLYGKDGIDVFPLLEDYAIYISSFAEPYEVAVFICYSASDTDSIAELCLERMEVLKVILRDTEYFEIIEKGSVGIKGRCVIMKIV